MFERKDYPETDEHFLEWRHSSGMLIQWHLKPGFQKKFALVSIEFGSIDNEFVIRRNGSEERVGPLPHGIAHFLEHRMFEQKDGDAFTKFAQLGASANAHTWYTNTSYLTSFTKLPRENLSLLLDMSTSLIITDAQVEKEKGIIEQEILMYEDDPATRGFNALMENLFLDNPVKTDIAGTVQSIRRITTDQLRVCFDTFYQPANMGLFISGDIDQNEIEETIEEFFGTLPANATKLERRIIDDERPSVGEKFAQVEMDVSMPIVNFGIKDESPAPWGDAMLARELNLSIAYSMLFSKGTWFYETMREEGLILDDFFAYYRNDRTYAYTIMGSETPEPEKLIEKLRDFLGGKFREHLERDAFERKKKLALGRYVRSFNSVEGCAYGLSNGFHKGYSPTIYLSMLENATFDDVVDLTSAHFGNGLNSTSVVRRG
ncbi:MAG: insulinase family protein [Planctomycetes bacterium]|nr:insulinase family protein [Planctomycetota bacterium]